VSHRAVRFDWRGTLATTLTTREWAAAALTHLGRELSTAGLGALVGTLHDADALYAVEPETGANLFADDVAPTLGALRRAGLSIAVVSDIHVDLRPAFAAAGSADWPTSSHCPSSTGCRSRIRRCSPVPSTRSASRLPTR
jgi:phosphoglycolate phosphatase-like HAD superfamily hydrolase